MKGRYFALLLACLPLVASAGDEAGHWYVDPYLGGISPDPDWNLHGGFLGGLAIGNQFTKNWAAELNLNSTRLRDEKDSGDTRLSAASLDVLRIFNRDETFAPYVSVGAGDAHWQPPLASSHDHFMMQAGIGAFIKVWEDADASHSFSLRPDIKLRGDMFGQSGRTDLLYTLGLALSFGPPGVKPVVAAPPPPPPAPPPPPPPPPVKCPGVPPGVMVDKDGCPIADVVLLGVNFETNLATLTAQSKPVLDEVAKGLKEHHRLKVELQGHTDSTGSAGYNLGLSQRRADSVRDYLLSQGVPEGQLTTKGYGETQPVASNATKEGRLQNRRVVMHVVENPSDIPVKDAGKAQEGQ
jgi:OmpA-OmpF porin, OOP family